MVTLIIFIDSTSPPEHVRQHMSVYVRILNRYHYRNLQVFYMCHQTNGNWWYREIMSASPQLSAEEVDMRVQACITGKVASAVVMIAAKKKFILFPGKLETVYELYEGKGSHTPSSKRDHASSGVRTLRAGKEDTPVTSQKEVGKILGNTLGYEESCDDDKEEEEESQDSNSTRKLIEQVDVSFATWLERLADGSLTRCSVEEWPRWH